MPNYTKNYNLKKPFQEEFYNIDDHNGNMDIIDEQLKLLSEDSGVVISPDEPEKGDVWIDTDDEPESTGDVVTSVNGQSGDVTLTVDDIGAAPSSHKHSASDITSGTLSVSRGGTGKSTLTSGSFLKGNGTSAVTLRTPAQVLSDIGAAAASHTHAASTITAGTFSATDIIAKTGTDYTTARIRNIKASTTDLTAGTSTLSSGDIYLVYE